MKPVFIKVNPVISSVVIFAIFTFAFPVFATNLPPQHEAARLMLAIESSVKKTQWGKVEGQLDALSQLDVRLPAESLYFNGLLNMQLKHYQKAQDFLEEYVVRAGEAGKFYARALNLITRSEEQKNSARATQKKEGSVKLSLSSNAERDGYIKSLQALYLTNSPEHALVMQINSLLAAHPYTGSRLKKSGVKQGIVYGFSVKGSTLVIQEKSYDQGLPTLSANTLNVLGQDPFLKFGCSSKEYICWVYHPADKHQRWLKVDYDELVVSELSDALSKLIQLLQKSL